MYNNGDRVKYVGNLKSLENKVGTVKRYSTFSSDLVVVVFDNSHWCLCIPPKNLIRIERGSR